MRQSLGGARVTGAEVFRPYFRALLAEAYRKAGQVEEESTVLAEALAAVDRTGERWYEAELYRLRGELTLAQSQASLGQVSGKSWTNQEKSQNPNPQHPTPSTHAEVEAEAEACVLKAIEIARKQQAKSLELRAVMSLRGCGSSRGRRKKLDGCWPRSTAGLPKGLTPRTCKRRRHC
jgi:hypothetical protein